MTSPPSAPRTFRAAGFRLQLWLAMMVIFSGLTAVVLSVAEGNLESTVARELRREFQDSLSELDHLREIRHAALVERCRSLVLRSRIHAALEDNAPDLLYPSAESDLSDLRNRAQFYRFLGPNGAVIPPQNSPALAVGLLSPGEEIQLTLPALTAETQTGYLLRSMPGRAGPVSEIITTPILSSETGEVIAALALGFPPLASGSPAPGIRSGLYVQGRLFAPSLAGDDAVSVSAALAQGIAAGREEGNDQRLKLQGRFHLLFYKRLNPGSLYPAAYEAALYSLAPLEARQRHLRWNILGLAALALLAALIASHFATRQLSAPVEKLAVDSERSARFSADASHQLKTPVTVLRAGLEELLARPHFTPEECAEFSALIHQTYRLSTLIDDLLLLSRMDAGRLKLDLAPVDLGGLIAASVDDLGAAPASGGLSIEADVPANLWIAGEKRYTAIILQNLLENARKYNRPGGRLRITAHTGSDTVTIAVGNTGPTIPPAAQSRIFERFHRGGVGENVPGYGLGLNLARELARIHGGELRLARSEADWTEFELRLRAAVPAPALAGS